MDTNSLSGCKSVHTAQELRGQALEAEKSRAVRGRETVSELDSIAHANRQLQQELASLQRQMRDKQEALQHEVSECMAKVQGRR